MRGNGALCIHHDVEGRMAVDSRNEVESSVKVEWRVMELEFGLGLLLVSVLIMVWLLLVVVRWLEFLVF